MFRPEHPRFARLGLPWLLALIGLLGWLAAAAYPSAAAPGGRARVAALPADRAAFWVSADTIAWDVSAAVYELHADENGVTVVPPAPGAGIPLTFDRFLGAGDYPQFPNIGGYEAWTIHPSDLPGVPGLLRGDVMLAAYDGGGALIDATRLQHQGVLDDLFAYAGPLGVTYDGLTPTLRVWAPTAQAVNLHLFADATTVVSSTLPLSFDAGSGVWSIVGAPSWDRQYYLLDVTVFSPFTAQVERNDVTDPYALNLSQNSERAQFLDLADADLAPPGWDTLDKPSLDAPEDSAILEVHIRDFSLGDLTVTDPAHRGTFLAFGYDGSGGRPLSAGMAHLQNLAASGLTHVHLLPAFDIASVEEDIAARQEVSPTLLASFPPDSDQQQALIGANRDVDGFNWGYDPYHYGAPEGSYAVTQNDAGRVVEFREMIAALNRNGLRVVMDVVYNHTAAAGQDPTSVLDKVVPGYYYRYDNDGEGANSSCCADTAAEFAMMQRLMVDTVLRWAVDYKVDGFRFDLMNLHTVDNMIAVRDALRALTLAGDGVDGASILLYGEGWSFGSAQDKGLIYANQYNMAGTGIGTFNDKIRDATHGGFSTDPLQIRRQGFINGQSYDWNGYSYPERFQGDLRYSADRLRFGLAGSLRGFMLLDQSDLWRDGLGFNGTGYATDPQEAVNYISKHDNETLFDLNAFKAPMGASGTAVTPMAERVRIQNLGLSLVSLAQGVPFYHMGSDMLRSKSLDRNSYDSGDWFNRVDFGYASNNFGVGLPPAWDNSTRWAIMGPMLADPAYLPAASDILSNTYHLRELLQIRASSPLFRLRDEAEIRARVHFHNTGSAQQDGLIVMTLSDAIGADLDANYDYLVVLFNANKVGQSFAMPALAGTPFALHPVQQAGTDSRVKAATYTVGSGAFFVPARTTAVFVAATRPAGSGDVDWVGGMYPGGGASSGVPAGDPAGQPVYVQAYEPGVTGSNNGSNGGRVGCALHWGRYGEAWSDLTMAFNPAFSGNGNNDEYAATIPTADLAPGTYGYSAYCSLDGGIGKTWRAASDGGDGILSILPPEPPDDPGVMAHLFEWRWEDIAQECVSFLGPQGYAAVQVSPPTEHIDHRLLLDYPWWARYQPVSYVLDSRSGSEVEFDAMVAACNSVGVDVIVDLVINHMTAAAGPGTGYAGNSYDKYEYPAVPFTSTHFHQPACPLYDYGDRDELQNCELLGLADLDLQDPETRARVTAYVDDLLARGVAGFRVDGAKHIFAADLEALFAGVAGGPYVVQEVIEAFGEPAQGFEYFINGDVTEFDYSNQIGAAFSPDPGCGGVPADAVDLGQGQAFMPSGQALVFVDNHDNQRGHGTSNPCIVTHADGPAYDLASAFMLAWPYGQPRVMSSYQFASDDEGPPSDGAGNTLPIYSGGVPAGCDGGGWVCEHRRPAMAHMVAFRATVAGQPVVHWWDDGAERLAFGLGDKGFLALNVAPLAFTRTYTTGLPAGVYCDVLHYAADGTGCTTLDGTPPAPLGDLLAVETGGALPGRGLEPVSGLAAHTGARVAVASGDMPGYGLAWHRPGGPVLGESARVDVDVLAGDASPADDGVVRSGNWSPAEGGGVLVTVTQADGYVSGWLDWNQDGDLEDAGETLFANVFIAAGQTANPLFPVPVPVLDQTFTARFRIVPAPGVAGTPSPRNGADGGEVEDYVWGFTPTAVRLSAAVRAGKSDSALWMAVSLAWLLGLVLALGPGRPGGGREPARQAGSPGSGRSQP